MIEICLESARSNSTSQRLAVQTRMILMKASFSDLLIIKICQLVNKEDLNQDPPTRIETLNTEKRETLNELKRKITKNRNNTNPSTAKQR